MMAVKLGWKILYEKITVKIMNHCTRYIYALNNMKCKFAINL